MASTEPIDYIEASLKELSALVSQTDPIEYKSWRDAAQNPNITPKIIATMLDAMEADEKNDIDIFDVRKKLDRKVEQSVHTKKTLRVFVRNELFKNKNLSGDQIDDLIEQQNINRHIIDNPSIKPHQLQKIFDTYTLVEGTYTVHMFPTLVFAKQVTTELLLVWYNSLKPFAVWDYSDATWQTVVGTFLTSSLCPIEVLKDAASAPYVEASSEKIRDMATHHDKTTGEIKMRAYEATNDEKYLPKEARDVFLF